MKKFVHTFTVVEAELLTRRTPNRQDQVAEVIVRLTVKQNWVSPASTIFTKLYTISASPSYFGITLSDVHCGSCELPKLHKLVGRSFQGYYENGQITVLVDMNGCKAVDLDNFEKVGSFNLDKPNPDTDESKWYYTKPLQEG